MERSPGEQEREIRNLLHRAERTPALTSALRKDALKRLIELARSPHQPLKKIAASNIAKFFKPFPDLEEDAINAIYDLCEDQDSKVRMDGYKAIVLMSKEQPKWVKRNADVLAQLLQSDEPDEVTVVKKALAEHLDMDSKITLGVLCDQIVPVQEPMEPEEKATRDRLRTLVLAFIAGEARRAIVERHASQAGSVQEQLIINGLFKTLSDSSSASDAPRIVSDILLHLPSFKGRYTPRGAELLQILLQQAESSVKQDLLPEKSNIELLSSRPFLDLAAVLSVENSVASPLPVLRFYCSSLLGKDVLQRLRPTAQSFLTVHVAEALAACSRFVQSGSSEAEEFSSLRSRTTDSVASLLSYIPQTKPTDPREWRACETVLLAVQQRKRNSSWEFSTDLLRMIGDVHNIAQQSQVKPALRVVQLTKSMLPPPPTTPVAPVARPSTPDPPKASAPSRSSSVLSKRKAEETSTPAPVSDPAPSPAQPPASSISIRGAHSRRGSSPRPTSSQRQRAQSLTSVATSRTGTSEQPTKRARKDEIADVPIASSSAPSLLSRLNPKIANGSGHAPPLPQKPNTSARNETRPPERTSTPTTGLSIKGAAKAAEAPPLTHRPSSLLDRIKDRELGERMYDSEQQSRSGHMKPRRRGQS